jgi:hypothetical protein
MKTGLHDRRRAAIRDRVAPHTGPMTDSTTNQQPSTVRGEAHCDEP